MLVNFTFQNFRSFREERSLRMEATSIKELKDSIVEAGGYRLLPAAVMYGANSSGKSNVLMAMLAMKDLVLSSVRLNPDDQLTFDPFRLDETSASQPTSYEIQFLIGDTKYRYGIEHDQKRVIAEWLYEKNLKEREFCLFERNGQDFHISSARFAEGVGKEESTPENRLFLSLVAQLNGKKAESIIGFFRGMYDFSRRSSKENDNFTMRMFQEDREECSDILEFYRYLQLGFKDLKVQEARYYYMDKGKRVEFKGLHEYEMRTVHDIYDSDGNVVDERMFNKTLMESEGTQQVISLSGPLFSALKNGTLLLVDELDIRLHPMLTRSIVQLFMNRSTNPNGAQLICTTHDTNLLDLAYLRRDQIWFTEKDRTESSDLYSLVEFKDGRGVRVRNDSSIEKDYIEGRYGAIPFLHYIIEYGKERAVQAAKA